jgi:hypothetical protein
MMGYKGAGSCVIFEIAETRRVHAQVRRGRGRAFCLGCLVGLPVGRQGME